MKGGITENEIELFIFKIKLVKISHHPRDFFRFGMKDLHDNGSDCLQDMPAHIKSINTGDGRDFRQFSAHPAAPRSNFQYISPYIQMPQQIRNDLPPPVVDSLKPLVLDLESFFIRLNVFPVFKLLPVDILRKIIKYNSRVHVNNSFF